MFICYTAVIIIVALQRMCNVSNVKCEKCQLFVSFHCLTAAIVWGGSELDKVWCLDLGLWVVSNGSKNDAFSCEDKFIGLWLKILQQVLW